VSNSLLQSLSLAGLPGRWDQIVSMTAPYFTSVTATASACSGESEVTQCAGNKDNLNIMDAAATDADFPSKRFELKHIACAVAVSNDMTADTLNVSPSSAAQGVSAAEKESLLRRDNFNQLLRKRQKQQQLRNKVRKTVRHDDNNTSSSSSSSSKDQMNEINVILDQLFYGDSSAGHNQSVVTPPSSPLQSQRRRQCFGGSTSMVDDVVEYDQLVARLSLLNEQASLRQYFVHVLNQYRSKKVEFQSCVASDVLGFAALGEVLRNCLTQCHCCCSDSSSERDSYDIHTAKVIIMLSQTFYQTSSYCTVDNPPAVASQVTAAAAATRLNRLYLKDLLSSHSIWRVESFWENVLWDLVLDQVKDIPHIDFLQLHTPAPASTHSEKLDVCGVVNSEQQSWSSHTQCCLWYMVPQPVLREIVRKSHEITFSQLMAIIHSQLELGGSIESSHKFLHKMCTLHQLEEKYQILLLNHLKCFYEKLKISSQQLQQQDPTDLSSNNNLHQLTNENQLNVVSL
jgi:hypothetical protein